jgi:2'-5' RNA ligase
LFNCIAQLVVIQVSELVRAFLSIDIENQTLYPQISETQRKLDTSLAKMKLVEIENIHFTLRFFGDTSLTRIDEIESCLNKIKIEPFEIVVNGVGAFPTKRKPRVIWIGVTQNADRIRDLKMEIDSHLEELGYHSEKKKFTPHATIARIRFIKDAEKLASNLDELVNQPIGSMSVSKFNMKKSTLTPSGPIYETLWNIS